MHIEYLYRKTYIQEYKKLGTQILLALYNLGLLDNSNNSFFLYKKLDKNNYMGLKLVSNIFHNISGYTFFFEFKKDNSYFEINSPYDKNISIDYHLMNIDKKQGVSFNNFIDKLFFESSFIDISIGKDTYSYFTISELFQMNEEFKIHEFKQDNYETFKKIQNKYLDILEKRKINNNSNQDIIRLKQMLDNEQNIINNYIYIEKNIFKLINSYYNKHYSNMSNLYNKFINILYNKT